MNWTADSTSSINIPWDPGYLGVQKMLNETRLLRIYWKQNEFGSIKALRKELTSIILDIAPLDLLQENENEINEFIEILSNQVSNYLLSIEEYELLNSLKEWINQFQCCKLAN